MHIVSPALSKNQAKIYAQFWKLCYFYLISAFQNLKSKIGNWLTQSWNRTEVTIVALLYASCILLSAAVTLLFILSLQHFLGPKPCQQLVHGLRVLPLVKPSLHSRGIYLAHCACLRTPSRARQPCWRSLVLCGWSHKFKVMFDCTYCDRNWDTRGRWSLLCGWNSSSCKTLIIAVFLKRRCHARLKY